VADVLGSGEGCADRDFDASIDESLDERLLHGPLRLGVVQEEVKRDTLLMRGDQVIDQGHQGQTVRDDVGFSRVADVL